MVRVFLVMPDLSMVKVEALGLVAAGGLVADVLVSYAILSWKPGMVERLGLLRGRGWVGLVMLDSGAYHHARGDAWVGVAGYAALAGRLASGGLVDYVVAPDVVGDPAGTLARTLDFASRYPGPFIPVAQPPPGPLDPGAHASMLARLARAGLLERAPRVEGGARLVGVGGLDGPRRRARYLARLVEAVEREWGSGVRLHLFGAGLALLRALARRGLLRLVYSADTTGWLAEIRYRRRTHHNAATPLQANYKAMKAYIEKAAGLAGSAPSRPEGRRARDSAPGEPSRPR